MALAAETTREVLWHMPAWAQALWYALATVSVVVFLYGVARPVAKYRRGHRRSLPARGEWWGRVRTASKTLATHASIKRRDPAVGWAHRGIFYGFVVLFIGTVVLAINTDVTERFFGWRFFDGWFYLGYSLVLDVLGLALLAGLLFMMVRRGVVRPRRLRYRRPDRPADDPAQDRRVYRIGDWVFVGALLYLVLTGYLLEGVRIAMDAPGNDGFSPAGWLASRPVLWSGASEATLGSVRHVIWWSHGLVAIAFVAAIPYTKAAHMLTSYAALVLEDPQAGKRLQPVPEEAPGYATLADFSINHLLQLDACTKCGRCHEVCPANATGKPLSPRDVILDLREQANASMSEVGVGGVLGSLLGRPLPDAADPVIGDERIRVDTVWSCMQCNACVEACPVGIEQAPIINQLRRRLVEDGAVQPDVEPVLRMVQRSGNSFGENKRRRGRWTAELEFEVKDARKEPVDVLWFVGDYASFDPRSQEVSRALARIYREAGVDFGILYDGERNAGNDVRRVGEEGLFEALAEHNLSVLEGCEFRRIVTSDPHSLNTLRNEYRDLGGDWEVVHHSSFLLELLEERRLEVRHPLGRRITYHDPCYLGRHNGGYDEPRRLLELVGCELVEMPRNRDNAFCCGAGGGRIWMKDEPGTERPSENRIREAVALGELDYFVVSCPKDVAMYSDAIKTTGNAERLELREITELIEAACLVTGAENTL